MKPLVIYHANCADGFGAAFAAWLKLGDEADYVPMQYGEVKTPADFDMKVSLAAKDNDIYILDFSFPREVMEALFKHAKRVVWRDHHASVFKDWGIPIDVIGDNEFFGIENISHHVVLNNNKSGALLAWEYFHPGTEVPMFIRHIDDYDRWVFALKGTKEINKAIWSYAPWSFRQWKDMLADNDFYGTCWTEGYAILRAHNQNVQAVLKGAKRPCTIIGTFDAKIVGLACNCPSHLTSDVGHQLANESGSYGLCWYVNKDNLVICSLRSNGDYDVSAIAKEFGGGGHRNAAGFTTTIQTIMEWTK